MQNICERSFTFKTEGNRLHGIIVRYLQTKTSLQTMQFTNVLFQPICLADSVTELGDGCCFRSFCKNTVVFPKIQHMRRRTLS